ncbi:MAG: tRNA adenosine(34) deaminase TadA [Gammaproteobacteria bacterium]
MTNDEKWMQHALALARHAEALGEVPVGAVIVLDDNIIGEGWNQPISGHDPTAHAEIVALRAAGKNVNNYRLTGAEMYVTLEPCAMCAGAIVHARIKRLVYAVSDPRSGAAGSVFNILQSDELNHRTGITTNVMEDESKTLIQGFFRKKRNQV